MDLDRRISRRNSAFLGCAIAGIALLFAWAAERERLPMTVVMTAPAVAGLISYLLVKHGTEACHGWLRQRVWRDLNGNYHAFDDRPVRVAWRGGRCLVAAIDVLAVMGVEADRQRLRRLALIYPEPALFQDEDGIWWFSESAVADWLSRRAERIDARAVRFRRWLEKETFPPLRRKALLRMNEEKEADEAD